MFDHRILLKIPDGIVIILLVMYGKLACKGGLVGYMLFMIVS
jgi:hypothetical protein